MTGLGTRNQSTPVSILLADDHEVVRGGLRKLIEQQAGWSVCCEVSNGQDAVRKTIELAPNIAIVDIAMPQLNGLEVAHQLRKAQPDTGIIIFTMSERESMVREVLQAGAHGYILKSDAVRFIVPAIEAVLKGQPFFSGRVTQNILDGYLQDATSSDEDDASEILTRRERELVQLLAEGHSNGSAGAVLGISVKTVETHRASIMRKLGFTSVAQVVRYAIRNRVIEP